VRLRNLLIALLLGTLAAVLPALAISDTTATVNATGGGYGSTVPVAWSPPQVSIAAGDTVTFANPSNEVPHGVIWTSSVKPTCSGVPNEGATHWSGTCMFAQAGTYTYECAVHGREMTGTVTVSASGVTTLTPTSGQQPTTSTPGQTTTTTTPRPTPKPALVHPVSRAQKLARALKACKKKAKGKRAACRRQAHKRYGHH
jgi:plastocyanin